MTNPIKTRFNPEKDDFVLLKAFELERSDTKVSQVRVCSSQGKPFVVFSKDSTEYGRKLAVTGKWPAHEYKEYAV